MIWVTAKGHQTIKVQDGMSDDSVKRMLLGLGLDNEDGHVRISRGKNFRLLGGSHDTHEQMQEKVIKFNEKLDARKKQLDDLEGKEFLDLAAECEMPIAVPKKPGRSRDRS